MVNTIAEIEECSMDFKGEVYTWINNLPLYHEFEDAGKKYIAVHAYIDDKQINHMKTDPHWDETSKGRDWLKTMCIYGLLNDHDRKKWWEDDCTDRFKSFHLVCGHYHVEKFADNYTMLDNEEELLCWIPSEDRVLRVLK
jgi:hypothetical protein